MVKLMWKTLLCSAIFLLEVYLCQSETPVFLWDLKGNSKESKVSESMSEEEFSSLLQKKFALKDSKKKIVLFLFDKLSVEDLHISGDSFQQLQSLLSRGWSHSAGSVPSAARDAYSLLKSVGEPRIIAEGGTVPLEQRVLLVKLQHKDLANADSRIGEVMKQLESSDVLAILTASSPFYKPPFEDKYFHFNGRRLLSVATENLDFVNVTADNVTTFMTYQNLSIAIVRENNKTVEKPESVVLQGVTAKGTKDSITLMWANADNGISDVQLKFSFYISNSTRRWMVQNLTLSAKANQSTIKDLSLSTGLLGAPLGRSFHCSPRQSLAPLSENVDQLETAAVVYIQEVQLQPFVKRNQWSDADDCVGFFSIGIWMGLVPIILFTVILAFGFLMIMDIKINDRFDDPRGKTIQVNASE